MGLFVALLAAVQAVPVVVPVPVPAGPQLGRWEVGPVQCDLATPAWASAPDPTGFMTYGSVAGEPALATYSFTKEADGRLLDIARVGQGYLPYSEDLAPSLAAARLAPGGRFKCSVRFTATREPVATAPIEAVFAFAGHQRQQLPPSIFARIRAAAGDCQSPQPAPLLRAFPDAKSLPRLPGANSWTVTRFDLDANGQPVRVLTLASSGNAAFDRAATDAVRRSRFERGVRHGCLAPGGLGAATIAAPPPPEESEMRPAGATCPAELPNASPPNLIQPEPYRRRSIEGWAVVAYDVAPWGATGNQRVLAAEPSAEFGDWARSVVRAITKAKSTTGYVGCVDRVRFRIGDDARLIVDGETVAPPQPPIPIVD